MEYGKEENNLTFNKTVLIEFKIKINRSIAKCTNHIFRFIFLENFISLSIILSVYY